MKMCEFGCPTPAQIKIKAPNDSISMHVCKKCADMRVRISNKIAEKLNKPKVQWEVSDV